MFLVTVDGENEFVQDEDVPREIRIMLLIDGYDVVSRRRNDVNTEYRLYYR